MADEKDTPEKRLPLNRPQRPKLPPRPESKLTEEQRIARHVTGPLIPITDENGKDIRPDWLKPKGRPRSEGEPKPISPQMKDRMSAPLHFTIVPEDKDEGRD